MTYARFVDLTIDDDRSVVDRFQFRARRSCIHPFASLFGKPPSWLV